MKNCNIGKSCQSTCIDKSRKCRKGLPQSGSKTIASAVKKLKGTERAQGQSLEGSNLNYKRLAERAEQWRKELGLDDPDDVLPGHDETHILMRDYIGKSSEQIGKLLGGSGKGPSVLEEIFVEVSEDLSKMKTKEKRKDFLSSSKLKESIELSIATSKSLGFIPPESPLSRNSERSIRSILRFVEKLSEREDFDQYLDTVREARRVSKELAFG